MKLRGILRESRGWIKGGIFIWIGVGLVSGFAATTDSPLAQKIRERDALQKKLKEVEKEIDTLSGSPSEAAPGSDETKGIPARVADTLRDWDVRVRRAVKDNKQGTQLPALFQYSHPASGPDGWLADVGVSTTRDLGGDFAAGIYGEFHYNNAEKQRKDSVLAGATLDWVPGDETAERAYFFRGTVGFKRDNLVAGDGVLSDVTYYPYLPRYYIGNEWGGEATREMLTLRINPYFGPQFEFGNGAAGFKDGNRFALRAGITATANLLPRYLGNRLNLESSFGYWENLADSGAFRKYNERQFYVVNALTYWLNTPKANNTTGRLSDDEKHFGITLQYSNGDSPDEGSFDVNLFTAGFSVRF